jgi:hypothetical protein
MPRRLLNILVAIVSLIWASLFTWTEIIDADPDKYSVNSPEFKQELANCAGNFAQRQACAERIAEAHQQLGFLNWLEKVAIILGPPVVLWGLLAYATREANREPAPAGPRRLAAGGGLLTPREGPRRVGPRMTGSHDEPHFGHDEDSGGDIMPPQEGDYSRGHGDGPGSHRDDGAPTPPLFSGGRRGPVRNRDR